MYVWCSVNVCPVLSLYSLYLLRTATYALAWAWWIITITTIISTIECHLLMCTISSAGAAVPSYNSANHSHALTLSHRTVVKTECDWLLANDRNSARTNTHEHTHILVCSSSKLAASDVRRLYIGSVTFFAVAAAAAVVHVGAANAARLKYCARYRSVIARSF